MRPALVLLVLALTATANADATLPELDGWTRAGKTASYDRATIWQAIDGAAELFVAFGFRSLREQSYEAAGIKVTAQLYEQGSPLEAFGVFARERPPGASPLAVGAGGAFGAGGHCLAHQGTHYLKLLAVKGKLERARCASLLAALCRGLPGPRALPFELQLLPAKGMIEGSLGYTPKSFLSTRRLQRCVHADYQLSKESKPYTLFVLLPQPGKTVDATWVALAAQVKPQRLGGLELCAWPLPYRGTVGVARNHGVLLGAVGVGDAKATAEVLRSWPAPPARRAD
jgi:hypothetical protein